MEAEKQKTDVQTQQVIKSSPSHLLVLFLIIFGVAALSALGTYYYLLPQLKSSTPQTTVQYQQATNQSTTQQNTMQQVTPVSGNAQAMQGWQIYTSFDKIFSISYPSNWTGDPCAKTNSCHTDAGPFDNDFSPATNPSWQVIQVEHTSSDLNPKAWLEQKVYLSRSCLYNVSSDAVNGYRAYFAEVYTPLDGNNANCPNTPPQGAYTYGAAGNVGYMDYYVVTANNKAVLFSMPVQDGSDGTRDTISLVKTFKEIAKSIKFN